MPKGPRRSIRLSLPKMDSSSYDRPMSCSSVISGVEIQVSPALHDKRFRKTSTELGNISKFDSPAARGTSSATGVAERKLVKTGSSRFVMAHLMNRRRSSLSEARSQYCFNSCSTRRTSMRWSKVSKMYLLGYASNWIHVGRAAVLEKKAPSALMHTIYNSRDIGKSRGNTSELYSRI